MEAAEYFATYLGANPIMGIFRGKSVQSTVELCNTAWANGVELVEVPVQNPAAMDSFQAALAEGTAQGKQVGAGTVLSVEQLEKVVGLGAQFTVAPGFDLDVVQRAAELGVPHLPGVATSSEIGWAVRAGCGWVKAFPAAELGASWVAAQKGPFPEVSFVATGGMSAKNAAEFLRAGFSAIAVGSAFETARGMADLAASLKGIGLNEGSN